MRKEGTPPPPEGTAGGKTVAPAAVMPVASWVLASGLGAAWALAFVFAFPGSALSTLMHEVLGLPGPGAGIALVLGPYLAFGLVLVASLLGRPGSVLPAAAGFGMAVAVCRLAGYEGVAKGAFGSPLFVAGVLTAGFLALPVLRRRPGALLGSLLAGPVIGLGLAAWYWLLIFPRTAGWVRPEAAALLAGLGVAAAALAGLGAGACARRLAPLLSGGGNHKDGGTHVRSR